MTIKNLLLGCIVAGGLWGFIDATGARNTQAGKIVFQSQHNISPGVLPHITRISLL